MRLVDIDRLPKGFIGGGEFLDGIKYVYETLKQFQPVDAVEVVRCKDCRHWGGVTFGFVCRKFSGIETKICMGAEQYCSYGCAKMDGKGEGECG